MLNDAGPIWHYIRMCSWLLITENSITAQMKPSTKDLIEQILFSCFFYSTKYKEGVNNSYLFTKLVMDTKVSSNMNLDCINYFYSPDSSPDFCSWNNVVVSLSNCPSSFMGCKVCFSLKAHSVTMHRVLQMILYFHPCVEEVRHCRLVLSGPAWTSVLRPWVLSGVQHW